MKYWWFALMLAFSALWLWDVFHNAEKLIELWTAAMVCSLLYDRDNRVSKGQPR